MFCPLEGHLRVHFTTFCPLEGNPRGHFTMFYPPGVSISEQEQHFVGVCKYAYQQARDDPSCKIEDYHY